MASGNVKKLLRSARECLGRREYREALQHCKEALAEDKSCYEAYIFVGKAAFHLQEHTQAEASYRRASDLDPRNPLAWQGLAELFAETGAWPAAAQSYSQLLQLAEAAAPDDALHARRSTFLRRYAEAAARAGLLAEAEAAWRALKDAAAEAAEATAAAAAATSAAAAATAEVGDAAAASDAAAAAAAAEGELVDCLCRLADVQLAADAAEIESRVAARLAAEVANTGVTTPDQAASLESSVRSAVEGEWAEEALELDADHASATLRRIIALRPPSPSYVPYYDAFLKRLRKYIQAAPPGSMDRHSRRAVLLAAAKATMEGSGGDRAGGCCSPYPYEAALAMLEVEQEVVGVEDPSLDPANPTPSLDPPPLPLLVADYGRIASRLLHSFPWSPSAQLHNALCLRRRAATSGFDYASSSTAQSLQVVRLPPAGAAAAPADAAAGAASVSRRRQATRLLLSALSRGGRAVSGWLAVCELLLEEGASEAALDAAKEGLKYVAHRDLVGKERLAGAGLLLRLLAGQALLRLRKLDEAQLLLEGLARGVSEGHVASGELAGIAPLNVSQQAKRYLAHVAAARGDLAGCRHQYDELVGGQLMGRSAAPIEAWAHGELGMLLLRHGTTPEGARFHLSSALVVLQPSLDAAAAAATSPSATSLLALQQEAATYQLHLALALWAKGGGQLPYSGGDGGGGGDDDVTAKPPPTAAAPSLEPFRAECRESLLGAAAVAGPLQAAAFTWLGHWYGRAADPRDEPKARRCYQRALALDPTQADAGEALVAALCAAGRYDTARLLCEEMRARAAAAATPGGGGVRPDTVVPALGTPSAFLVYPGLLPVVPAAAAAAAASVAAGSDLYGSDGAVSRRATWALRSLARLQRDVGFSEAAVTSYQAAIRLDPEGAELWEGLASSYQSLGRHTAALKSYGRALELSPGRLFSRLQAAALHYQMGSMPESLSYYRAALAAAPQNAAALLGCGEVLLAQAALAARMGAAGAAAAELAEAATVATEATRLYGNLQAGWKLLGDVRLQHAAVPTLESIASTRGWSEASTLGTGATAAVLGGTEGDGAVQAGLAATRDRLTRLRLGRRAYAAAVHLDPRVAGLWGDLGMSYHLELELAGQHPELAQEGELQRQPPGVLRRRALALARGGLRLDPASDWLWGCSGTIAAGAAAAAATASASGGDVGKEGATMAAAAEFSFCRALQLNPRRAPVWASLGRLYAAHGEGVLASRCFDSARSHEPTSVAVWEAMGDAALRRGGLGPVGGGALDLAAWSLGGGGGSSGARVTAAWREAADAYEHAQLLGGDVESRLGYVLGRLLLGPPGAAADGSVLAAAVKATALHPLQPAGHHARGLALEARGDYAAAVQAFQLALQLVESEEPSTLATPSQPSPRPLIAPLDPRVAPSARAAVQLDLARALAAAGRAGEAVAMYDGLPLQGVVHEHNFGARLSYGLALLQVNRTAEALSHLTDLMNAAAAPVGIRLAAATAVVRSHVTLRRWDEAYGTVLTVTSDVPDDGWAAVAGGVGGGRAAEAAARLWLVLLAGLVAARAPELEAELLAAARQWAMGRQDLDTAQFECRILELLWTKHRAAGDAAAALLQAARAVHACPYDRSARAALANTALQAGPGRAAAAARAAPRDRPPHAAAAAENAAPSLVATAAATPLAPSAAAAHATGVAMAAAAAAAGCHVRHVGAGGPAAAPAVTVPGVGAALLDAVRDAAARMRRVVHAEPYNAAAWYLCALTEMQHAIASGGHARLYRSTAVAARAAAACATAELQWLPTEASLAPPAAARPVVPPGMPAALAMAMAAQAARTHAAAASDPRVVALRAQRAVLADVGVRSLALLSESHLQLRLRGGGEEVAVRAREAAQEALGLAASSGVDASPAHRQLARFHLAQGDVAAADAAYDQAVKSAATPTSTSGRFPSISYELLPVLEWAAVQAASGRAAQALQLLNNKLSGGGGGGTISTIQSGPSELPNKALVDVAWVHRALVLLQLGEAEAAREVVSTLDTASVSCGGGASGGAASTAGLRSAAHAVQAASALVQASVLQASAGDAAAHKKCMLEARWAAREALKPLTASRPAGPVGQRFPRGSLPPAGPAGPGGALACLLLGLAEAGLGKEEAAAEQLEQASRLWPHFAYKGAETTSIGAAAAQGAAQPDGRRDGSQSHLAHAVHCRPWSLGEAWSGLVAMARAR